MSVKKIMSNIIEEEISKLEQSGEKVRFKTVKKKRIIYTVVFGAFFVLFMIAELLPLAFIDMLIYFIMMYNANNARVITKLAKKSPDTLITDIIKGEIE